MENKGLEAFENIKKVKVDKDGPFSATYLGHDKRYCNDLSIIEKELKDYEELKKVFAIIKDKQVNVANFIQWLKAKEDKATYKQYLFDCVQEGWFIHPNDGVVKEFPGLFLQTCEKLTEEEFNLLKGWLSK